MLARETQQRADDYSKITNEREKQRPYFQIVMGFRRGILSVYWFNALGLLKFVWGDRKREVFWLLTMRMQWAVCVFRSSNSVQGGFAMSKRSVHKMKRQSINVLFQTFRSIQWSAKRENFMITIAIRLCANLFPWQLLEKNSLHENIGIMIV